MCLTRLLLCNCHLYGCPVCLSDSVTILLSNVSVFIPCVIDKITLWKSSTLYLELLPKTHLHILYLPEDCCFMHFLNFPTKTRECCSTRSLIPPMQKPNSSSNHKKFRIILNPIRIFPNKKISQIGTLNPTRILPNKKKAK